ncbi:MAG: hypothetical protein KatS3mg035_1879 [Bacteroidia bacterium]|nr:MAG: hypothetical protein KatS3mg035_1879 [Bacteroidia bacterium]
MSGLYFFIILQGLIKTTTENQLLINITKKMRIASSTSFIKFILPAITFIIISNDIQAQQWKRYRKEVHFGLGANYFLGELGGANQIGTNFVRDLEISTTRPAITAGYRYNISAYSKLRGTFTAGTLKGDDNLTQEPFRNNRNLHFRTRIYELNAVYEYYFNQEQSGHRYNIKGAKGMRAKGLTYYAFGGIGIFYFNPKAQYNGNWIALQPLGTEGQGLPGGGRKYSRVSIAIPYGLGLRYAVNRDWKIGLEVGMRKTFTDYIDDVSGNYYDNKAILQNRGIVAATLADPNKGAFPYQLDAATGRTRDGLQRGDPKDKDSYGFITITACYRLKKRGSRAKF